MGAIEPDVEYRRLFEESCHGCAIADASWRIGDANDALARLLGFGSRAELIGRGLDEFAPDPIPLRKLAVMAAVHGHAGPLDMQLRGSGGQPLHVSCSVGSTRGDGGATRWLRAQLVDIAESRQMHVRLAGAQRMEAIARLAGGLAHDFNNLLTIITGQSDRLDEALPGDDPLRASVDAIRQASARAASMTRQLLAFSRRQVFELRSVALDRLVIDARPLLTEIAGNDITLRLQVTGGLPEIRVDPRQIEQVIAHLALNAREAMSGGGTLTIAVAAAEVGDAERRERPWLRPGRYVQLTMEDTGRGMDAPTQAYAFEPFFTTKPLGHGTGLGLATVYGIVKQSNGFIWVDSVPGRGAKFTLLFPAIAAPDSGAGDRPQPDTSGSERILIFEADARMRSLICRALRHRGYQVLEASSSAAAIELFAAYPSRVDLLVSAQAPAAEHVRLAMRLKAVDATLQVLMMVDPAADAGEGNVVSPPGASVIEKPFTIQALAERVRQVLDSGEGRSFR